MYRFAAKNVGQLNRCGAQEAKAETPTIVCFIGEIASQLHLELQNMLHGLSGSSSGQVK